MPVRFNCPVCSKLLGIGSRKIGSVIHCPKCQGEIIVPTQEEAAAAATELDRFDQPDVEETLSSLVVYEQVTVSPSGSLSTSHAVTRPAAERRDEQRYVSLPRWALYLQGALIAGMALVFFVAGYWIAAAPTPNDQLVVAVDTAPSTARLSVRLTYVDSKGAAQPDGDAVVLALPVQLTADGMKMSERISIDGLRPSDPAPSAADPRLIELERRGIVYGRTNVSGEVSGLIVTAGRKYHLLILSNHATRPRGVKPRLEDSKSLDAYFNDATKLLGDRQYLLVNEETSDSVKIVHEFGRK